MLADALLRRADRRRPTSGHAPARPSAGHGLAPVAVAGRRAGAAQRAVGVPLPAAAVPRQPAPARRSCACSTRGRCRRPPRHRLDGAHPRRHRQPSRPPAARRRRGARGASSGCRRGPPARPGAARLARAGDAAAAARGAARRQLPRPALRRPQRLHGRRRRRPVPRGRPTSRSSAVDETLFANLLSDQDRAAARRAQLVRGRPHDADRPVRRRGDDADPPRRAGRRRDAVRDQRPGGDRLRRGAVHQPDRPPGPDRRGRLRGPQGDLQPRSTRSSGRRRCCSSATRGRSCSASGSRQPRCRRRPRRGS